jgi:hypothetical protein
VTDNKKPSWRDSLGFSVGCGLALLGFYVLLTIGHYYNDGWGPNQWGPVASWVGSTATFLAIGVALYQNKNVREDARHEAARAEGRFRYELQEADKRHKTEMRAANRDVHQRAYDDDITRNYEASRLALTAAAGALSAISTAKEFVDVQQAGDAFSASVTTEMILNHRANALKSMNLSLIDLTIAIAGFNEQMMRRVAVEMRDRLEEAVAAVSGEDAVDWNTAFDRAQDMNREQRTLQKMAMTKLRYQRVE